jgi:hypothetical protein
MPDLKMEMRLLNARDVASRSRGIRDLILPANFHCRAGIGGLSALLRALRSRCPRHRKRE